MIAPQYGDYRQLIHHCVLLSGKEKRELETRERHSPLQFVQIVPTLRSAEIGTSPRSYEKLVNLLWRDRQKPANPLPLACPAKKLPTPLSSWRDLQKTYQPPLA